MTQRVNFWTSDHLWGICIEAQIARHLMKSACLIVKNDVLKSAQRFKCSRFPSSDFNKNYPFIKNIVNFRHPFHPRFLTAIKLKMMTVDMFDGGLYFLEISNYLTSNALFMTKKNCLLLMGHSRIQLKEKGLMRWINFFGSKEEKSKVAYHWDGISVAGVGSIRLSNLPQNLNWIASRLLTLSQSPGVLFYGIALLARVVKADDCHADTDRNVYLNYSEGKSFLRIAYNSASYVLGSINNTCNFTMANKQPGDYEPIGCFCYYPMKYNLENYKGILFGQNISAESTSCIELFLEKSCITSEEMIFGWIIVGLLSGVVGTGALIICCAKLNEWVNKRGEQQALLLNPEEQEEHLELEEPPRRCLGRFC